MSEQLSTIPPQVLEQIATLLESYWVSLNIICVLILTKNKTKAPNQHWT